VLPEVVDALDRDALIQLALANRGEVIQVTSANRVTELEIAAQASKWCALKVGAFAGASDIHAQPIPQGTANGEYKRRVLEFFDKHLASAAVLALAVGVASPSPNGSPHGGAAKDAGQKTVKV